MMPREWIVPDWPAPQRVRAFATTRQGGVSEGPYGGFNLRASGNDKPEHVARNREILRENLPEMPHWLVQKHTVDVVRWQVERHPTSVVADGAVTSVPGRVCAVLTGDCMQLLLCNDEGTQVGAVHAGWRGMAAGVIESGVRALGVDPRSVMARMGPTIGQDAFEVGPEVLEAFRAGHPDAADAFRPGKPGKLHADLYHLARQRLALAGVTRVYGGGYCTYTDTARFFSYRREKESGRMGSFIWIDR
jgi:YfiH family protein